MIELNNITYTYNRDEPSARVALNNVSFKLSEGDFVVFSCLKLDYSILHV